VQGVNVGPTPELSCRGLVLEGVVTESDTTIVSFESSEQVACTSANGVKLVVAELQGDLFKSLGVGPDDLKFSVRVEESERPEAGFSLRPLSVRCDFDLEM
jgi:hypothetical protein